MGLYRLQGTISQLGQCEFDNDLVIYAFIEILMPDGGRRLLKKVAVCTDIGAAIGVGTEGEFFFDEVFVVGRRFLSQFWGVKTDHREVVDSVNLRTMLTTVNLLRGIIFTPILLSGLPDLLAGIGQAFELLSGSVNRGRFFKRTETGRSGPAAPLSPERLGYALRGALGEAVTKGRRQGGR
jgi:hypothetical protein